MANIVDIINNGNIDNVDGNIVYESCSERHLDPTNIRVFNRKTEYGYILNITF